MVVENSKDVKKRYVIFLSGEKSKKRYIASLSGGTAPTPPPAKTHFSPTHPFFVAHTRQDAFQDAFFRTYKKIYITT